MASVAAAARTGPRPDGADTVAAPAGLPLEHSMLLTATLCLLAGGAVMVYSASAPSLLGGGGSGTSELIRFVVYGARRARRAAASPRACGLDVGAPADRAAARASRSCCCSRCGCRASATRTHGAQRWLGAGPLQFEPSELMKLALVLYAAHVLSAGRPGTRAACATALQAPAARRRLRLPAGRHASPTSARRS